MTKVGIIGSGMIVNTISKEIIKDNFKITGIYSRNKITRDKLAKKLNAISFNNIEEMINNKELFDFIYIATPHSSHYEYASLCLRNKIPVLVEKPLAINKEEVMSLIELNKKYDTYIAEAMWTWFGTPFIALKKMIDSKKFGNIRKVRLDFEIFKPHFKKFRRLFDPKRAGGALMDLGIYLVTTAYKLFGKPFKIEVETRIIKGIDVHDIIVFKYEGFDVQLTTGFTKSNDLLYIELDDTIIKASHGHRPQKIKFSSKKFKGTIKGVTSYLNEFIIVSKEIKEDKKQSNYVTLEDNLNIMELMDEIRQKINLKFPFEK